MSCIDSSTTTNGGFRVNVNLRKRLQQRKRRLLNRIDKSHIPSTPAIDTPTLELQLADRTQAISAGGLCPFLQMIKTLDLRHHINSCIPIFKVYAPYDEADHVLNIALNLLAGGTCLDHLEIRRTDEAYLNALGAQRIPDPTTAGDFCRRFDEMKIIRCSCRSARQLDKQWCLHGYRIVSLVAQVLEWLDDSSGRNS